jgi:hypothetical protein
MRNNGSYHEVSPEEAKKRSAATEQDRRKLYIPDNLPEK